MEVSYDLLNDPLLAIAFLIQASDVLIIWGTIKYHTRIDCFVHKGISLALYMCKDPNVQTF